MKLRLLPNDPRRTGLQISLLGGLAILLLWGAAAIYIAPAMEQNLQQQADQILEPMKFPVAAVVDGLQVRLTGVVPGRDARFEVRRRLYQMHPLARVRLELNFVPTVAESTLPTDNELQTRRVGDDVFEKAGQIEVMGSGSCEDYKELDPNFTCFIGSKHADQTMDN